MLKDKGNKSSEKTKGGGGGVFIIQSPFQVVGK